MAISKTQDGPNGGKGHDVLFGDAGADTLKGHKGDDILVGRDGDDVLRGDDGEDRLLGQSGDDVMTGGKGDDVFVFEAGSGHDVIRDFGRGDDLIRFNDTGFGFDDLSIQQDGKDLLITTPGGDTIRLLKAAKDGVSADDFLFINDIEGSGVVNGGAGDDILSGGDGADQLNGFGGDDILVGACGDDTLLGGAGRDRLLGQSGDDVLSGGADRDVFVFRRASGDDVVTDYEAGLDVLRFNNVDFDFGDLAIADAGGDLRIETPEGDSILLTGMAGVSLDADAFIFA